MGRLLVLPLLLIGTAVAQAAERPNIVFIMADDLGYADLGCYGQQVIRTPRIDQMAAEGIRFTQIYAGTSVCAPTRCVLMTGLHTGHAPIRANRELQPEGQMPLPKGYVTLPEVLNDAGYSTACVGKWGLGMFDTVGSPLKRGFDHFYGYNCQRHAHSYFPDYLWDDDTRVKLDGKTYSQNLLMNDALGWIREQKSDPFFLYLALTIPHGKYEIAGDPGYDNATFEGKPLTDKQRTYAAMVTRMDSDVGRVLDLLKELKIDDNTVVFFTSDHGAAADFFNSSGPLRGIERSMYEGGLRVPMVVRWPREIEAGQTSDAVWTFWDVPPTLAELAGTNFPSEAKIDGLSAVAALRGKPGPKHDHLYWELHEGRFQQAVRQNSWKAVRNGPDARLELFNLAEDPGEKQNVAGKYPEVVREMEQLLADSRTPDPAWPMTKPNARKMTEPK